jgi:hypothetical protein
MAYKLFYIIACESSNRRLRVSMMHQIDRFSVPIHRYVIDWDNRRYKEDCNLVEHKGLQLGD